MGSIFFLFNRYFFFSFTWIWFTGINLFLKFEGMKHLWIIWKDFSFPGLNIWTEAQWKKKIRHCQRHLGVGPSTTQTCSTINNKQLISTHKLRFLINVMILTEDLKGKLKSFVFFSYNGNCTHDKKHITQRITWQRK